MRALIVLLLLAGCVTATATSHVTIQHCPPIPKPPAPLPALVTTPQLRAWAEETEAARVATVRAYEACRDQLNDAARAYQQSSQGLSK